MTTFTKGQRVNLVQNYDGKGVVSITPAIVYSCGKKQMVLTHASTGAELGRNFKPTREGWSFELVLTENEDSQAIGMELATRMREKFIAAETKIISESNGSPEYWAKRQAILDEVLTSEAKVIGR